MATTIFLPSYEAALADIEKVKERLSLETQQMAEAAMAAEIEKDETKQKLLNEVKALGDAAIKVDQTFNKVSSELGIVDQNDYTDRKGNPIPKLRPRWDGFHNSYTHILWTSRDVATDTATYILDFYTTYLPAIEEAIETMSTAPPEQKAAMISDLKPDFDAFLKKENPATANSNRPAPEGSDPLSVAQVQSQDFLNLKREIEAFQKTVESFAEGTSEDLQQTLNDINATIERLNLEISSYRNIIKGLAIAMGATGLVAGAGALGALIAIGPLGPAVALGVLIVGAMVMVAELGCLISYMEKKSVAEGELAEAKERKANVEAQLATLERLKTKLESQTDDINYITGRLDQFANIWGLVASDARACDTQLKNASEAKGYAFLKSRVALLKKSYTSLYCGLREYAVRVGESGVSKPKAM